MANKRTRNRRGGPPGKPLAGTTANGSRAPGRSSAPSTKQARVEQARREREELQRGIAARRRNLRLMVVVVPAVVIAAGLAFVFLNRTGSPSTGPSYVSTGPSVNPATLPGINMGPPPWPVEATSLRARLQAIGLPALSAEGTVLHIHQHLDVFVDGRKVTVPADIGINEQEQFLSPLHTHDTTGIIHVESPTRRDFTLGQLFDVWGVRFTASCIGGKCAGGDKALRVYVDGHLVTGDPRQVKLIAHAEIVVAFGTVGQVPKLVPSSYSFPFGL